MAGLNVWVPDELADRGRSAGLNVSALTQAPLSAELSNQDMGKWLDAFDALLRQRRKQASHEAVMQALDEARDEFGLAPLAESVARSDP